MRKVVITINSGKVTADYTGFQGKSCEVLANAISIGEITDEDKQLKPEYHTNTNTNTENNYS